MRKVEGATVWKTTLISFICFTSLMNFTFGKDAERNDNNHKALSVLQVVKFPNDGCNTTSDGVYGVCYSGTECTSLGGTASGSCASGFGVCCAFTTTCGGVVSLNNTYFSSSDSDSSPCSVKVCKSQSDICLIRLNFDKFDIAQPSTTYPTDDVPNSRGSCNRARFTAESEGPSPPVICGTNTGHHMILEAKDSCNKLTFTWLTKTTREWKIQVMQISCNESWKPSVGCLQYFTGTTGTISSYNYAGEFHLNNQYYANCIRTEEGYCSISFSSVSTSSFYVSHVAPSTGAVIAHTGEYCSQDWVTISGGGETSGATTSYDRFCGSVFSYTNAGTATKTVITNKMPFRLGVNFDETELDSTSANEWSKGFKLYYSQNSC